MRIARAGLNRVMDNSKILRDTGLSVSDLTPIKRALKKEYDNIKSDDICCNAEINKRMDEYIEKMK